MPVKNRFPCGDIGLGKELLLGDFFDFHIPFDAHDNDGAFAGFGSIGVLAMGGTGHQQEEPGKENWGVEGIVSSEIRFGLGSVAAGSFPVVWKCTNRMVTAGIAVSLQRVVFQLLGSGVEEYPVSFLGEHVVDPGVGIVLPEVGEDVEAGLRIQPSC